MMEVVYEVEWEWNGWKRMGIKHGCEWAWKWRMGGDEGDGG